MTVTKTATVWCDHDYDPATGHRPCPVWYADESETARDVRRSGRPIGWRHIPGHPTTGPARDLCPRHAREAGR